jgi:hypothetical protein
MRVGKSKLLALSFPNLVALGFGKRASLCAFRHGGNLYFAALATLPDMHRHRRQPGLLCDLGTWGARWYYCPGSKDDFCLKGKIKMAMRKYDLKQIAMHIVPNLPEDEHDWRRVLKYIEFYKLLEVDDNQPPDDDDDDAA